VLCWSDARTGRSRSDSSIFNGSDVVHDLRWATVLCIDGVLAALGVHDFRKLVGVGVAAGRDEDGSGDSGFHRLATGDERVDGLNFPTSGLVELAAASRALLAFTIDWTNPRPLRRLILGVGSFSFGG
jgi:hypothetical protein